MTLIERLRPDPIPSIHPVAEYLVTGQRKQWYEEMKSALQVPWMGVVTMAYAHYPTFFAELWRGLKPLCESREFVQAFQRLRQDVEDQVKTLAPKPLLGELRDTGYAPREIEQILAMNTVFSHGNQPYVIIAAIVRHLLEIGDIGHVGNATPSADRHGPGDNIPFILMEAHHADGPTQAVFDDVKSVLRLPFVNTDYRAFARWPSYFSLAWGDLRDCASSAAHEAICQRNHDYVALMAANGLPNPGNLSSERLRAAASQDAPLEEVIEVCRLFQWLLPGLITNVAYFRAQLDYEE